MFWQEKYANLNADLLQAHIESEPGRLAELYTRCADTAELHKDTNATCFYLTHALVYALDAGLDEQGVLVDRLKSYGRI